MKKFRQRLCCGYPESDTTPPQTLSTPNPSAQQPSDSSAGASSNTQLDTTLPQNAPCTAPRTRTMFEEISNVKELKKLLGDIDKEITRQETNKGSDRKAKALKLTAGNVTDAEDLFAKFASSCRAIPFTDVAKVSRKVIQNLLQGLGSLHWAATGFSMIAFILTRLDQVGSNFDTCITILKTLCDLGHHVVNLDPLFDDKAGKLQQAIALISKGAILCAAHMNENSFKRFALAAEIKSNFEGLQDEIRRLYPGLMLSLLIQQRAKATIPLAAQEHEDPPEHKVALEEKVEEVLRLLGMADERTLESGVKAITLHGMGGIGKSTLGNAVCKRLPFTERSFVKVEIGLFRDDTKILKRQHDILERLSGQKPRIGDFAEGQQKLKSYLRECKHPVLLFLDSVEHESDLTKLLPEGNYSEILCSQSRIVVTSRDERMSEFFIDRGITSQKYSVQLLEPHQSKEFFTRQVFGDQAVPPDREQPVNEVLRGCDGLPLALEVTGRYLRRHKEDVQMWGTVISYLKNMTELDGTKEDKLVKSLSFSYDFLSEHNQIAFLDIVGLLKNFAWKTVDSIYGKELADLKSLALVKKSKFGCVEVHDLIVALGHRNQPSSTTRIRVDVEDFLAKRDLPDDYEGWYGNVQGLVVKSRAGFIPAEMLDAMSKYLRILILEDVEVRGKCTKSPRCLQVCSTTGTFPFDNLAVLKELRVLKISQNKDMSLDNVELPSRLEVLEFDELHLSATLARLTKLPDNIFELTQLRTLSLEWCSQLEELPSGLWNLMTLERLSLNGCKGLKSLPSDFSSESSVTRLKRLDLSSCQLLQEIPEGFGRLITLEKLDLNYCEGLTKLPHDFFKLTQLRRLSLRDCSQLQELPDGLGDLVDLEDLDLRGCARLTKLPYNFSQLKQLRQLNLWRCAKLRELPQGLENLDRNLRQLEIGLTGIDIENIPSDVRRKLESVIQNNWSYTSM